VLPTFFYLGVSQCLFVLNDKTHLSTTAAFGGHQLVVFIEHLDRNSLLLLGGALAGWKTPGNNKGLKQSYHRVEMLMRGKVQRE
jgi:hypothetical protein